MESVIAIIKNSLNILLFTNHDYIHNETTIYNTDYNSSKRLRDIYNVDVRERFIELLCRLKLIDENLFYEQISISRLFFYFHAPENESAIRKAFYKYYSSESANSIATGIGGLAAEMQDCLNKIIRSIPEHSRREYIS